MSNQPNVWVIVDADGLFMCDIYGWFRKEPVWCSKLADAKLFREEPSFWGSEPLNQAAAWIRVAGRRYNPAPKSHRPRCIRVYLLLDKGDLIDDKETIGIRR